ncbi:hypothetical protein B0G84_3301 [Paraburkholderia sp. BL8N3]|nr:hypothetical protein [Paraburkholderia sp. BL8N3]TCK37999.1 hypothetical protein B0G84_3301 [Paraburkholderia sp. BL8N3]
MKKERAEIQGLIERIVKDRADQHGGVIYADQIADEVARILDHEAPDLVRFCALMMCREYVRDYLSGARS